MYDIRSFPSKHHLLTASSDDLGQYGSIFTPDSERDIPEPLNLYSEAVETSNADKLE